MWLLAVSWLPVALCGNPPTLPSGDPNPVFVQIQMVEISKIDGVEQAFRADFYFLTT